MDQKFFLLVLCVAFTVVAQTNLSGSIGGMTLGMEGNPYVINENVTIPAGKKVIIKEGCIFLFNPFSGIIVEGSIEVIGSRDKPVILTSINDSLFNPKSTQPPEPFDWNGIVITVQSRQVHLTNFMLKYSVYGIKSQTEDLQIESGIFSNNGQFQFTIKDAIQAVTDSIPYSYGIESAIVDTLASKPLKKSSAKKITSILLIATGVGGLGGMGYSLYQIPEYHKKYDDAPTQALRNKYYNKQILFRNTAIISAAAGAVFVSLGVFFFLKDKSDNKHVSITPYLPYQGYSGINITLDY
jgi:hypothetical protein